MCRILLPSGQYGREEGLIEEPKLLKTEEAGFWKGGGESKKRVGV
jgi:hypothetical protein